MAQFSETGVAPDCFLQVCYWVYSHLFFSATGNDQKVTPDVFHIDEIPQFLAVDNENTTTNFTNSSEQILPIFSDSVEPPPMLSKLTKTDSMALLCEKISLKQQIRSEQKIRNSEPKHGNSTQSQTEGKGETKNTHLLTSLKQKKKTTISDSKKYASEGFPHESKYSNADTDDLDI